jgi:hypothetical protein
MMFFDEKPTTELITSMVEHLTDVWRETHSQWMLYDTFYDRTFQLWDPKLTRPIVHPAKPKSIVDTAVDQMMGHEPTYERFPRNPSKKDEADSGEKALKSIHTQTGLLEAELTLETVKKNLVLYGYAVLEDDLDPIDLDFHLNAESPVKESGESKRAFNQRKALFDHKKKTLMPFRNRAPHPSDVLMDPSHKNPRVAIKVGKWFAGDLVDMMNHRFDDNGEVIRGDVVRFEPKDNPFELIECVEYWTACWHALMVKGSMPKGIIGKALAAIRGGDGAQLLMVEPNTWEFVPFSHAFAGWGHQPTNAHERGTRFLAIGMLDSIMDDLVMDAQRTAGMHNALVEATFPKRGTRMDAANLENQEAESDTISMDNKGDLWYFEQPQLPGHLQAFGVENDQDIQEATFNRGLGGHKDVGVSTVGQQAIINTAGHRRFIAPTQQVNQLFTKSAEHILQWIDILDLDLVIEGNPINRAIIDGDYSVKVEFRVVDPVLQLQVRQQAFLEWQAGAMDYETFLSVAGRGDATGARERLMDDMVWSDPRIQEAFKVERAKQMGLDKLLAEEPDARTEGISQSTQTSGLVGPDGQPLASTLGTDPLRQPLDSRTAKPSRIGQDLAG